MPFQLDDAGAFGELITDVLKLQLAFRQKYPVRRLDRLVDQAELTILDDGLFNLHQSIRLVRKLFGRFYGFFFHLCFFRRRLGGVNIVHVDVLDRQGLQGRLCLTLSGIFQMPVG